MRNKTKELYVANVCKNREEKFNQIVPGKTKVVIIKGKNKNKIGTVIKTSAIKNNRYCGGKYRNYFIVSVSINSKSIVTSCDNIMFIDCNKEIERKFLVKSLPNLDKCMKDKILQGYISKSPEVRVRQKGSLYFLTIKSQGTLNRKEFETLITLSHFKTLWYDFIEEHIIKTKFYKEVDMVKIIETNIMTVSDGQGNDAPWDAQSRVIEVSSWKEYVEEITNYDRIHRSCLIGNVSGFSLPKINRVGAFKVNERSIVMTFRTEDDILVLKTAYLV